MEFRKKEYFVRSEPDNIYFNGLNRDEVQTLIFFLSTENISNFEVYDPSDKKWYPLKSHPTLKGNFQPRKDLKVPQPPMPAPKPTTAPLVTTPRKEEARQTMSQNPAPANPIDRDFQEKTFDGRHIEGKKPAEKKQPKNHFLNFVPDKSTRLLLIDGDSAHTFKIKKIEFPIIFLERRIQAHHKTEFQIVITHQDETHRLTCVLDIKDEDFVDSKNNPGIAKTSRLKALT